MDISFYVLLTIACMVLLLAMWACAAAGTPKWGPDLTLHLPVDVIRDALFRMNTTPEEKHLAQTEPSAPCELQYEPLLRSAEPMGLSSPPPHARPHRPAPQRPAFVNTMVRVLPTDYVPQHRVHPVFCTFSTEEKA